MAEYQYMDGGNSEAQDRLATSFLLTQSSPGLAATGALSGLAVTQTTTASGSVLIAAGAAAVQASVGTGVALLVNDTQATLDVFTTNPMGGLPRNDVVAFDSVTKALIAIIGTPNAAPTDPTVPATACALARLRHAAGATTIPTAKIDDLRVYTGTAWVPDDTGWITPTLLNGWVPFGSGFRAPAYRRLNGDVELRGTVKSGTAAVMFTLPPGFRPAADEEVICTTNGGSGVLRTAPTGDVTIAAYLGGGTNGIVSIKGMRFAADA